MKGTILHQLIHLLLLLLLHLPIPLATVGNCDSVSSMSAALWKPAAVQVYEEFKELTLP